MKINGKDYKLHYTLDRIAAIETVIGKPFLSIVQSQGILSINETKTYFAYGLQPADRKEYVSTKKAMALAEAAIKEQGYLGIIEEIFGQIQKDCGFFFRAA